jgi:hypothetical protein
MGQTHTNQAGIYLEKIIKCGTRNPNSIAMLSTRPKIRRVAYDIIGLGFLD